MDNIKVNISSNKYYVYVLIDPSKDDTVFYVGKGTKYRVNTHYTKSEMKKHPNSHKTNTIRKYRELGLVDKSQIVQNNLTENDALKLEKELITRYGRSDLGLGSLTNNSFGGEKGASGKDNNISKLARSNKHPSYLAAINGMHWNKNRKNSIYNKKPWLHFNATTSSKAVWYFAKEIQTLWELDKTISYKS